MKQFIENVVKHLKNEFPEYTIETNEKWGIVFKKGCRKLTISNIGNINELIWDERIKKGRDIENFVISCLKDTIKRELEEFESKRFIPCK